jgi:hypothetical protein
LPDIRAVGRRRDAYMFAFLVRSLTMFRSEYRRSAFGALWFGAILVVVSGCTTKEELPKTYTVKGKVVLRNGKPLTGGFITFTSVASDEQRAYGDIKQDGTFTLDTVALTSSARSERLPGAIEGDFKVTIRPAGSVDDGTGGPPVGGGRPAFTLKKTYKIEAKENNELTVVVE